MNESLPPNSTPNPAPDAIAEQNTARLLAEAYRPELPDPALAQSVKEAMLAVRTPPTFHVQTWLPRRSWQAAVAAILLIVAGVLIFIVSLRQQGLQREGSIVYIEGRPYVPADHTRPSVPPGDGTGVSGGSPIYAKTPLVGGNGLTARPATSRPALDLAQIGQTITTAAGQRRRVGLSDGSVFYINQKTSLRIDGPRRVTLHSGEAYFEVSPRQGVASVKDPTFLVKTPSRAVAALGTRFVVEVGATGTGVVVTQGKVDVEGMEVYGGEELVPEKENPEPTVIKTPRVSVILDWIRDLVAAAQTPLVPSSNYDGGALIAIDPWGQECRLTLRNYTIDVYIENGFARTTIDQTYFNNQSWRMEGTFYFPLPADASLSRLAMYVDGNLMEGGMCEREQAREVYESIVYQRRDPALLEWVDGTTFKMRVFPLEGRQEKRIILSYTQKLSSLYGQAQYRFPAGHTMSLVRDWSFKATVKDAASSLWNSDSHSLTSTSSNGDLVLAASDHVVKPNRDVTLSLGNLSAASAGRTRFAAATYEGRRYLMVRAQPPLTTSQRRRRRDWVFLFESSGARDPLLARAQIDIVRTLLENAEHNDTFAIVTAGAHVNTMGDPLPVTAENIARAVAYLENVHLIGALDLGQALDATTPYVLAATNPYLVHLGTGISILGTRAPDELVKRIPVPAKYVGIGVGKSWSRQFMKAAAALGGGGGGYFTQINPDEPVAWRAFDLLATLNTPRLLDVKVADAASRVSFLSFDDALAQGQELCAIARFPANAAAPTELTLTGTLDGRPYSQTLRVTDIAGNAGYLPRMWAKLEIDRLMAENSLSNKSAIITLSKDMYVMSPYTSLLVLENEAMYQQYHVDRGRKDHWAMYPAPDKIPVVYEPDPLRTAIQPQTPAKRLTQDQALASILVRMPAQLVYWPNEPRYYGGNYSTALNLVNSAHQAIRQSGRDNNVWVERLGLTGWLDPGMLGDFDINGKQFQRTWDQERWDSDDLRKWSQNLVGDRFVLSDELYLSDFAGGGRSGMKTYLDFSARPLTIAPSTRPSAALPASTRYLWETGRLFGQISSIGGEWKPGILPENQLSLFSALELDKKKLDKEELGFLKSRSALVFTNGYNTLRYQRPSYNNDSRVFSDLLQFAPGMNTSVTDIQAVLDAEATPEPLPPGAIDPQAHTLIDRARAAGWRTATLSQGPRLPALVITFDGTGRYRYERTLSEGLHEIVVCDGATLVHLYSDIGLGARRAVGRIYRQAFATVIPWALPTVDDMARGNTITLAGYRTIQIAPTGLDTRKDDDGKPVTYGTQRLVFAADGRLIERRWVEMPSGRILGRQTYSAAGVVQTFDDQDKEIATQDLAVKPASEPSLTADTRNLVVVPMPVRTREIVLQGRDLGDLSETSAIAKWPEEQIVALIAADLSSNPSEAATLIASRFFAQGDRRIGFFTLLLSSNYNLTPDTTFTLHGIPPQSGPDGHTVITFRPLADHPGSALAQYCVDQWKVRQQGANTDIGAGTMSGGFIERLAAVRSVLLRLSHTNTSAVRTEALQLARECKDPMLAWALVTASLNYGGGSETYTALADTAKSLQNVPGLAYVARYEEARALYQTGIEANCIAAKAKFLELYNDTLAAGGLPLIDYDFRRALQFRSDEWPNLMRQSAATLKSKYGHASVLYLAWQCYQIDQPLYEELVTSALVDVPEDQRAGTTLVAVRLLQSTGQYARGAALLQPLLDDPKWNGTSTLWSLAAQMSYSGGMVAQGLTYQEKAMDLEFANLPPLVNLQALRSEYSQALSQYLTLAKAIATLQQTPSNDLVTRVIRTADRWRALDPDKTASCQAAARVFQALNVRELAWDYMTTPLAEKSNEAQPWANLAQLLRQQGDLALADRAYATAFDVEPTNAQVLWDRALLLQQMNNPAEARRIFQQLVDGKWEPRFSNLQSQAKTYLQNQ